MSVLRAAAAAINLRGIVPLPSDVQVQRKLRQSIVLRWVLIAVIAAGVMLTPQAATPVLYLLAAAAVYNAVVMVTVPRASGEWGRRLALGVTTVDHVFCFVFLGFYASHVAGSQPLGGYSMATIEAVFYFGAAGAVLSLAIFIVCATASHALGLPFFGHTFDGSGIVNSVLLLSMVAVCLIAAWRIRLGGDARSAAQPEGVATNVSPNGNSPVHLSRREREVLGLVAEGYSNTMIATRLGISDSTVKGYVESLLYHLSAKNRAEAVAAASRLKLL